MGGRKFINKDTFILFIDSVKHRLVLVWIDLSRVIVQKQMFSYFFIGLHLDECPGFSKCHQIDASMLGYEWYQISLFLRDHSETLIVVA